MQNRVLNHIPVYFDYQSYPQQQQEVYNHQQSSQNITIYEPEYFLNIPNEETAHFEQNIPYNKDHEHIGGISPIQQYYEENTFSFNNSSNQLDLYRNDISHQRLERYNDENNLHNKNEIIKSEQEQMDMVMINPHQNEDKTQQQIPNYNHEQPNPITYNEDSTINDQINNETNSLSLQSLQVKYEESEEKKAKNQNILKNIFNAFQKFIKSLKNFKQIGMEQGEYSKLKKQFNRYMKVHSFNHSIIRYVLTHKNYKVIAQTFFNEGHFDQWVNSSKISNKDEIKSWAAFLSKCIYDSSLLDCLTIYQSHKNKKEML